MNPPLLCQGREALHLTLIDNLIGRAEWQCHLIVFSISAVTPEDASRGLSSSRDYSQLVTVAVVLVSDTRGSWPTRRSDGGASLPKLRLNKEKTPSPSHSDMEANRQLKCRKTQYSCSQSRLHTKPGLFHVSHCCVTVNHNKPACCCGKPAAPARTVQFSGHQ